VPNDDHPILADGVEAHALHIAGGVGEKAGHGLATNVAIGHKETFVTDEGTHQDYNVSCGEVQHTRARGCQWRL